jgi:putative transposase
MRTQIDRIVGYSIDDNMTSTLAVNALRMAIQRRQPVGTIVHSDPVAVW